MKAKKPLYTIASAKKFVDKMFNFIESYNIDRMERYSIEVDGLEVIWYDSIIEAVYCKIGNDIVRFFKSPNMDAEYDGYDYQTKFETFDYAFKINDKYVADAIMSKLYDIVISEYKKKLNDAQKQLNRAIRSRNKSPK
jgi:hypothetical protein